MESLGTKRKFWHTYDNTRTLFKIGRPGTGENWAEKIACELARLMGLPHAEYELARFGETCGINSPSFLKPDVHDLIQGNILLFEKIPNYPDNSEGGFYGLKDYQLSRVLELISKSDFALPLGYHKNQVIQCAVDVFIGYIVFDCWIANQDRHHENWGIIYDKTNDQRYLAPTYDHASSLACRMSITECTERLNTNDCYRSVAHFAAKAKSPFFSESGEKLKTLQCVAYIMQKYPEVCGFWINQIQRISEQGIQDVFEHMPADWMKTENKQLVMKLLKENKKRLVELC